MSTVHAAGIDEIIDGGMPTTGVDVEWGLSTVADDTMTGITNTVTTDGANPRTDTPSDLYSPDGAGGLDAQPTPTWTANVNGDSVEQFKLRVDQGQDGSFADLATFNSSADFGFTTEDGSDITVSNFDIDCVRAGIAEALESGISNLTAHIYLTDGNGARFGEAWAEKTPPSESINGSSSGLFYSNDKTFTNDMGADRTVGGIEVEWAGTGNIIIDINISNVTLSDGSEIVFTTLEVNFSGLD